MKSYHINGFRQFTYLLHVIIVCFIFVTILRAETSGWPRDIETVKGVLTIYQPHLESFSGNQLTSRAAVSFTPTGSTDPTFGVIWFKARVSTDRDSRVVTLEKIEVSNARFPEADQSKIDFLDTVIKDHVAGQTYTISLDRILAALELAEKQQTAAQDLDTTPPKIIYTEQPAVLVTIDGQPQLQSTDQPQIMRVINTPYFIVLDRPSKQYYLKLDNLWASTDNMDGPWRAATDIPDYITRFATEQIPADDDGRQKDQPPLTELPQIMVATSATELIQSDGAAKYSPIGSSNLLYMSNTQSDVFMTVDSQKYYTLISGRWYVSPSLADGPWSFVSSKNLPADFAEIPADSEKSTVLASVANTEQARDAMLDNYIPQTSKVDRNKASVKVTYDGSPQFEKIEGTEMSYAVNTSFSVILFNRNYYCCDQGVWYQSRTALGPWEVAVTIPKEIYSIPPDCPVYNTRYVYVYDYDDDFVHVGYTPGYTYCYVYDGVVVYGTGYRYRYWYRRYYYPRPWTYGFAVHYNTTTGNWGFRYGYRNQYGSFRFTYYDRNYFGPYGYHRQPVTNAYYPSNIYNRRDNLRGVQQANVVNQRENLADQTRRDWNEPLSRELDKRNNIYADQEGNIYRRTDSGWQQRQQGTWADRDWQQETRDLNRQPLDTQRQPLDNQLQQGGVQRQSINYNQPYNNLNREYNARQHGSNRTYNYQQSYTRQRAGVRRR